MKRRKMRCDEVIEIVAKIAADSNGALELITDDYGHHLKYRGKWISRRIELYGEAIEKRCKLGLAAFKGDILDRLYADWRKGRSNAYLTGVHEFYSMVSAVAPKEYEAWTGTLLPDHPSVFIEHFEDLTETNVRELFAEKFGVSVSVEINTSPDGAQTIIATISPIEKQ